MRTTHVGPKAQFAHLLVARPSPWRALSGRRFRDVGGAAEATLGSTPVIGEHPGDVPGPKEEPVRVTDLHGPRPRSDWGDPAPVRGWRCGARRWRGRQGAPQGNWAMKSEELIGSENIGKS